MSEAVESAASTEVVDEPVAAEPTDTVVDDDDVSVAIPPLLILVNVTTSFRAYIHGLS
jgi:hypothetical protein